MNDIKPSDVQDGDLLSGTLYGNPFTDWPVIKPSVNSAARFGGTSSMYLQSDVDHWLSHVTVTARKPAPKPLLPWEEHPDALWQHEDGGPIWHSSSMADYAKPNNWRRVIGAVPADTHVAIPRELIERLRGLRFGVFATRDQGAALDAILDAADES